MENVFKTMHSGFSSPTHKDSQDKSGNISLAEHFGAVVSGNQAESLNMRKHDLGNFELEMELLDATLIYKTRFQPFNDTFAVPLSRKEPTLTMMFQEQGTTFYNTGEKPLVMSPGEHSFNYFPDFDCNMNFPRDDLSQSLIIKLKADYVRTFSMENDHLGGWFFDGMEKDSLPVSTLNGLPITPDIRIVLHQIKNCPYAGGLRKMYIDGLIRILLSLQLDAFNTQVMQKKPFWQDEKINRQDIGKLHEVKEFLDRDFLSNQSLFALSRKFGLNEFKLKYGFKKMFGIPVIKYLIEQRMNYGLKLLSDTDMPVSEIAQLIGYEHPNNFTAGFKRRFGKTPQYYRNLIKSRT